jgi:hypothetical protein
MQQARLVFHLDRGETKMKHRWLSTHTSATDVGSRGGTALDSCCGFGLTRQGREGVVHHVRIGICPWLVA